MVHVRPKTPCFEAIQYVDDKSGAEIAELINAPSSMKGQNPGGGTTMYFALSTRAIGVQQGAWVLYNERTGTVEIISDDHFKDKFEEI